MIEKTIRNCFTCRDCDDCELNEHMDDEHKAIDGQCDCWEYPYDYSLRECPFCGNPAEIIDDVPHEWNPNIPVKAIRCSNKWGCPGNKVRVRFSADDKYSEQMARNDWNRRKRKNKCTWRKANEKDNVSATASICRPTDRAEGRHSDSNAR